MTDHDELVEALQRALDRDRHPLAHALARAFSPPETTTSSTTSLTDQDHQLARRLGAEIHTPHQ